MTILLYDYCELQERPPRHTNIWKGSNETHHLALDTVRTLFDEGTDCQFVQYMPLLSTVFAVVWITMFTMCQSGGHARTGLTEPWRILAPALLFALVMIGLTGHSLVLTKNGIHDFCHKFYNITNSTACSSVDPYIEKSWQSSWLMSERLTATCATSAGAAVSWALAGAALILRCLLAPDFQVKRTTVYLSKDPEGKLTAHLKKSTTKAMRSPPASPQSPIRTDNISVKSEPTVTTELVTASVEQGDTAPTSLNITPVKTSTPRGNHENIELAYTDQERLENQP